MSFKKIQPNSQLYSQLADLYPDINIANHIGLNYIVVQGFDYIAILDSHKKELDRLSSDETIRYYGYENQPMREPFLDLRIITINKKENLPPLLYSFNTVTQKIEYYGEGNPRMI